MSRSSHQICSTYLTLRGLSVAEVLGLDSVEKPVETIEA